MLTLYIIATVTININSYIFIMRPTADQRVPPLLPTNNPGLFQDPIKSFQDHFGARECLHK